MASLSHLGLSHLGIGVRPSSQLHNPAIAPRKSRRKTSLVARYLLSRGMIMSYQLHRKGPKETTLSELTK